MKLFRRGPFRQGPFRQGPFRQGPFRQGLVRQGLVRTGVRLALLNAAIVIIAFGLSGYLTRLSIQHLSQTQIRDDVRGEMASVNDEVVQKGESHLQHLIAKRTRLWRGFNYRLVDPQGRHIAGILPATAQAGWSDLVDAGGGRARHHHYLVYTERLADGAWVSVGQDLAVEAAQIAAVTRSLVLCGGAGVGVCLILSYLFSRRAWRRIAAISDVAREVTDGRLDVRVQVREGGARDDVDELGLVLNAMLARTGSLLSQLRQVSTDIAHDLRTPLTRLRQKLERLRDGVVDQPALLGQLQLLDDDVEEILRTFDALLQLSEIESQVQPGGGASVDLGRIAEQVAEAFRPDIEESGRILKVDCASTLVDGDAPLLSQAVANLLENAMRHTPQGSCITVKVDADSPQRLLIRDDGPGIPTEQRLSVLKPFVRLESSRSTPGSGLGLSIVAAVAARHKAALSLADARPGLQVEICFR